MLARRCFSSASKSLVVLPSSGVPRRVIIPALWSIASESCVLPAPEFPTRTTFRIASV